MQVQLYIRSSARVHKPDAEVSISSDKAWTFLRDTTTLYVLVSLSQWGYA